MNYKKQMNYKLYTVQIFDDGYTEWTNENGKLDRNDGPALIYAYGGKEYYLDGIKFEEKDYWKEISRRKNTCHGKIIEIDGVKYKLDEIK